MHSVPSKLISLYIYLKVQVSQWLSVLPMIIISSINLTELKNVELLGGKNDPYVVLECEGHKETTAVLEEAGSIASYNELNMKFETRNDEGSVEISVYDKNHIRSDVLIGKCSLKFGSLNTASVLTTKSLVLHLLLHLLLLLRILLFHQLLRLSLYNLFHLLLHKLLRLLLRLLFPLLFHLLHPQFS